MILRATLVAIVSLSVACAMSREVPHGEFEGFNLLFVTVDTLRPDRLGAYGSKSRLTPHLDRLASEGVVFENVLSHAPLTLPSHASIFTARYPTSHGVHDNGTFRLAPTQRTLASRLKEDGYATGAFVGAFVLDARFGLDHGFDVYDDRYGEKRAFESFVELERRAEAVLDPAERFVLEARSPWLAWVHLFDPHAPYEAPEPFRSRHADDPYGAEVAYVDDALGEFLLRLQRAGRLERTLVVVVGDHGESLGEHGELTHGVFAYEATLRVPWILWARGLDPARFKARVRLVDVVPTVLDLLGAGAPEGTDGASLRAFLYRSADYEPPPSYFEALNPHLSRDWAPLRGLVEGTTKLIDLPIPELYDLERDPKETKNLAFERAKTVSEIRSRLESLVSAAVPAPPSEADADTLRRLESLGYLVAPKSRGRPSSYSADDDPKRLIAIADAHDRAGTLFREGRAGEAVAILRELVAAQPRSSFGYQKLAYALHQLGETGEAVRTLEAAVESGVTEPSLLVLLASYHLESGEAERARGILEALAASRPELAEIHNLLGVAYARLGLARDARRELESVLALDPTSASALNNLGSLALSAGDVDGAAARFEEALAIDAGLASAHNGLGVARARRGDLEGAIESWRRAVELSPAELDALRNLALALAEAAPEKALPYLERFVREAPESRYRTDVETARRLASRLRSRS